MFNTLRNVVYIDKVKKSLVEHQTRLVTSQKYLLVLLVISIREIALKPVY